MMMLLGSLMWPVVLLVTQTKTAAEPAATILPIPDLSLVPVVTVMDAQGGDGLVVQRPDKSYLTIQMAGVLIDSQDSGRRHAAWAFLHNLLAGERVWIVRADASKPAGTDKYYVYRWPDRLAVNLEMVRQGYGDTVQEKTTPQTVAKIFTYWRDQARVYRKGMWAVDVVAPIPALAVPVASAPASAPATQVAQVVADKVIVYVGASGKKYHTADCKSLRGTKTPMTLAEAKKAHEPCRQCNPPK